MYCYSWKKYFDLNNNQIPSLFSPVKIRKKQSVDNDYSKIYIFLLFLNCMYYMVHSATSSKHVTSCSLWGVFPSLSTGDINVHGSAEAALQLSTDNFTAATMLLIHLQAAVILGESMIPVK